MTTVLSAAVLDDRLTPLQLAGGAVMITALILFQINQSIDRKKLG
jgi:drug/metabolite transporter (DMT)-like permease